MGGTDQLTYAVQDPYGKVGTATIQIAVSPTVPSATVQRNEVEAAPGKTVSVDVLASAVIAPGDPVTVSLPGGPSKTAWSRTTYSSFVLQFRGNATNPLRDYRWERGQFLGCRDRRSQ